METNNANPTTVSNVANLTGGIAPGNLIETDIDEQLYLFNTDDTPLMNLMLRAKRVKVNSPEVDHYMIDEPAATVTTVSRTAPSQGFQTTVALDANEQNLARPYTTLLVNGVDGYSDDGLTRTPGKWLLLFVVGHDTTTNDPVVRAINGPRQNATDEFATVPEIPAGTRLTILANSLYETQKEVDPDIAIPQPTRIFLQKRGMNQVVSDYFESQRKRLPFSKAVIAEQAIANFKVRGNRTLWAGRQGKLKVNVPKMGMQYVYTTEGLRWQFKREFQHVGAWTVEKIIAMAKMFFTGEDVPKTALLLAGKNLLEQLQCIDFSKHPEIHISTRKNTMGWSVTCFHTVFGDIEIKREPTLDRLGWSNSGALIGEDRLVHYVYSSEHSFSDRVDGEEATRNGILIWDAVALKGSCHIWIDGESNCPNENTICLWNAATAPTFSSDNATYLLVADCPAIDADAKAGQTWTGSKSIVGSGETQRVVITWKKID